MRGIDQPFQASPSIAFAQVKHVGMIVSDMINNNVHNISVVESEIRNTQNWGNLG